MNETENSGYAKEMEQHLGALESKVSEQEEYLAFKAAHMIDPAPEQLVTKEDVQAAIFSLAKLAAQTKRVADMLERLSKQEKDIATSMKQIAFELKKNKWN